MASPHFVIDYRRLRRASALTGAADGMIAVALPLLAAGLTSNPLAIAGVMAIQHLPWVLAEYAGQVLNIQADRRTIVGLTNTLRALVAVTLGGLSVQHDESIVMLYVAALILGIGEALTDEAEDETLDILLEGAIPADAHSTLRSRGMTTLALIGLPMGGLLYGIASPAPFMVAMVAYSLAALLALFVKTAIKPTGSLSSKSREVLETQGLPHSARPVVLIASVTAVATSAVMGVFVLYATTTLTVDAPTYGLLLAAFAASSYMGGQLAPWVGERFGIAQSISAALATTGIGYVITSLLAGQSSLLPLIPLIATSGTAMCAGILLRAMFQTTHVAVGKSVGDEALRSFHLATWSAISVGALLGGITVQISGFPTLFLVMGGLIIVGAALATTLRLSTPSSPARQSVI